MDNAAHSESFKSLARAKLAEYQEWKDVYEMSIRECHNTDVNNNVEETVFEVEESYSTSVAHVSGSQAMRLINQYLQKIPVDRFTKLTPAWKCEVRD